MTYYHRAEDGTITHIADTVTDNIEGVAKCWENSHRTIGRDTFNGARVSTVFLAIDHNSLSPNGPPVLWETMVFTKRRAFQCLNEAQWRFTSEEAAKEFHDWLAESIKRKDITRLRAET